MTEKEILSHVDHTLLSQTATWEEIKTICEDAMLYGTASVCIPPSFVKKAKEFCGNRMKVCTVIGFPNGYNLPCVKAFEAEKAVEEGADEIDMVINIGLVKEKKWDEVQSEIALVRKACEAKILKVIIETCLLTDEEKIKMCHITGKVGADYIKTSTGFSTGGATKEDVALFAKYVKKPLLIKAAGGIKTLEDAEKFLALGADRLGTSRVVKLVKEKKEKNNEIPHTAY